MKDKRPEDIDFVVVRENTEDMYAGIGGWLKAGTADEVATQTAVYTRKVLRQFCIRWAYRVHPRKRSKKKQTHAFVAKTNVLTYSHDLLVADLQRCRQGISGHQDGLQPRRCPLLHVDGQDRVLRRDP